LFRDLLAPPVLLALLVLRDLLALRDLLVRWLMLLFLLI
jgi:hypothetical protein